MDALHFNISSRASGDVTHRMVANSRPQRPCLNHYKEQFLFTAVEFPYYSNYAGMVGMSKRLTRDLTRLRHTMRTRRGPHQMGTSPGPEPL